MFSLREYLTKIHTLPCGAVDEIAVGKDLQRVGNACFSWARDIRVKEILFHLRISL